MILALWLGAVASVALWAAVKPRPRDGVGDVRYSVIRPCHGDEPGLAERLFPTGRTILAVASEDDSAMPIVRGVAGAVVVVTGAIGPNAKAEQVAAALAHDDAPFVVIADSDVEIGNLDALLAPFADPRVAAVWAPPIEVAPRTLADHASAGLLDASLHAFALLGALDPGGMVGKLVALRRSDLDAVGGFSALRLHLGEDMELARRIRVSGKRIVMTAVPVQSWASGRSWSAVVARYARWLFVIRAQRPLLLATYPLVLAATFPIAILAVAFSDYRVAIAAFATRLFIAAAARLRSRSPRGWFAPGAALLADILLWAAFLRALGPRTVLWRGHTLRIGNGGLLVDQSLVSHDSDASASRDIPLTDCR